MRDTEFVSGFCNTPAAQHPLGSHAAWRCVMQHGLRENPGNAPCRGLQPALLGSLCLSAPWEQSTDGLPQYIHVNIPLQPLQRGTRGMKRSGTCVLLHLIKFSWILTTSKALRSLDTHCNARKMTYYGCNKIYPSSRAKPSHSSHNPW